MSNFRDASVKWFLKSSTTGTTPDEFVAADEGIAWHTPDALGYNSLHLGEPKKRVSLCSPGVRVFPKDSVLIVGIGTLGKLAVAREDCSGNQQLNCLVPNESLDPRFLAYALSTKSAEMYAFAGSSTLHILNQERMRSLRIPVVPHERQRAIASFLDEQTARIDALIAEKAQLGRSLEEFRLSAIHEALSVGLDREAPTVDTGDEWFARVPTHWAFCPLNYRYEVQLGKMLDEKRITGAHLLPYLRNTDVQWDRINSDSLPAMDIAPTEMPRYSVKAGDLLVCEGGEVGRAAIWEGPENAIGYQKALHRVRPRTTNDVPRFLFYALFDSAKRGRFESRDKATIAHLTAEAFRRYRFTFPPYAEQTAIVRHLDSLTSKIDGLQRHCTEHIERLREYRASLISAAVTGQLDINSYKEAA